jgi:hypothetical protein
MGNWRTKHPVENGSFPDDSVDWMDTPEGQQSIEALDLVFGALDHVDVDASQRKIVWTDGKRLSIEEAAERLHAERDIPRDLIETQVFGWLENCAPESYTAEQMEEFDQLMEPWLADYERKRPAGGK